MIETRHPMTGRPADTGWPIRMGGSTGRVGKFGWTRNGGDKHHAGVDYLADVMAPVYAAHAGVIVRAGFERSATGEPHNDGYGSRIWIRQRGAVETRYAHLVMQVYQAGMTVEAGELIGFTGRTGNVGTDEVRVRTHLHFEWREWVEAKGIFVPVNPEWALHGEPALKYG